MTKSLILAGIGGGIGSMLRLLIAIASKQSGFPLGTLLVNILGSFAIGIIIACSMKDSFVTADWKTFLATGICGGFTTFSAFSMENLQMFQEGKIMQALLYIIISLVAGITAAWIGFKIAAN